MTGLNWPTVTTDKEKEEKILRFIAEHCDINRYDPMGPPNQQPRIRFTFNDADLAEAGLAREDVEWYLAKHGARPVKGDA